MKAKRELEHNQYEAYCLEFEGNEEYDEAWSSKERGKRTRVSNIENVKNKNSKLKPNSTYNSTSSPTDTEYSNLDTSVNIPLITELTDFLATEAAELAVNEDMNDESLTPTNLDALDYKPVSIVHLRNTRNNKLQQK